MPFLTLNQALALSPVNMAIVMHPLGTQLVRLLPNGGTKVILKNLDDEIRIIEKTAEGLDKVNRSFTLTNINCRPVLDEQEAARIQDAPIKSVKKEKHSHCQIFICTECKMVGHLPTIKEGKDDLIKRMSAAHHEHSPTCMQPTSWIRILSCKSVAAEEDIPEWALLPISQIFEEGEKVAEEKIVEKQDNPLNIQIYFCEQCKTVNYVEIRPGSDTNSIRKEINRVHERDAPYCPNIHGKIMMFKIWEGTSKEEIKANKDIPEWAREPIIRILGIKEKV